MKNMILQCLLCAVAPLAVAATPEDEISEKVPAALAIIDGWQSEQPERAERRLHVVLWTPADRDPAPRYRQRLTKALHDIRDFYGSEMTRLGFGPRSLKFAHGDDGLINIHLVKGAKPYAHYQTNSGSEIRGECVGPLKAVGVDADKETIVIFCNMSNWDPEKRTISQNSPYYAGGTHRNGTAWQVDSPILDLEFLDKKEPMVRDGQYGNISIGRYNSIFIGGVCHELGHALGLPHNCARPDEAAAFGTALMGSGNRSYGEERRGEGKGSFLTLAHGLRLASHPMFSGSVKGIDIGANAVHTNLSICEEGGGFVFSGRVKGNPPVYAVIAYMDPDGGGDYDATTATAVPDAEGDFVLHCNALARGKKGELRIVYLQANGVASGFLSATPYRYRYAVDDAGKVDISSVQTRFLLIPLLNAMIAGDKAAVEVCLSDPRIADDPRLKEVAGRLAGSLSKRPLREVPEDTRTLALADLAAVEESTGYGRPLRDRLPGDNALLSAGGKIFAHGFYAHAPARHVWELDGSWKTLKGYAGMADGFGGSVNFVIEGDGRELWRSPVVKEGGLLPWQVNLSGVRKLLLRTEDGGDGNRSDWALWLEPVLER